MPATATQRRNGGAPQDPPAPARKNNGNRKRAASSNRSASVSAKRASTKPKAKPAGQPKAATKAKPAKPAAAKRAASKAGHAVSDATPSVPKPGKLTRKLALAALRKAAKPVAKRMLEASGGVIRTAVDGAASTGHEAAEKAAQRRLPIQRAVDVAVPLRVAWEEWMAFESIPEGIHTVTDIEQEGDELSGRTSGPRSSDWRAEILDEREQQSFAWRSYEGSDCAGLITFHELSRRLTRIELNLDVVPSGLTETTQLALRLADRRAETELRRFKARLELINPDLYETEQDAEGGESEAEPADDPEALDEEPDTDEYEDEPDEGEQAA